MEVWWDCLLSGGCIRDPRPRLAAETGQDGLGRGECDNGRPEHGDETVPMF